VLLRGVQPQRWLHVPGAAAVGLRCAAITVMAARQAKLTRYVLC